MANNVKILIEAEDKASKVIDGVNGELTTFWKNTKTVGDKLNAFAEKNKQTFQTMAIGWTAAFVAISAWISKAIDAYAAQAKAIALVENGMIKYADTWTTTTDDLIAEATRLQKTSIFGDEEILQKVTNNLLTFWSIGEEIFSKTQQTALDLATTLEWDLQSSAIMLWKALEDPATWLSALTRVGIKFTQQQQDQIKALQKSGDLLGAQNLVLESIEWLYGWAAQAAADALWPSAQLSKEIGDLVEELWWAFRPAIDAVASSIRPFVESITNRVINNKELASSILIWVGVIAWFVAVLWTVWLVLPSIITGVTWVITVIKLLWTAMMFLAANPIWALITVLWLLVALVVANWDTISAAISWAIDRITAKIQPFVDRITWAWTAMSEVISTAWSNTRTLINDATFGYLDYLSAIFAAFKALFSWDFAWFVENIKMAWNLWMESLKGMFSAMWQFVVWIAKTIRTNIKAAFNEGIWFIVNLLKTSKELVSNAFTTMIDWFVWISKWIFNGVVGIIEWFVNKAIRMFNKLIQAANSIWAISIPLIPEVQLWRLAHGWIAGEWFFGGETMKAQGYATGGVVKWAGWLDQVPAMLTAWEVVLNAAQQRNVAAWLWGGWPVINVTITWNEFFGSDDEFADKIGDTIMQKFKFMAWFESF